jgi:small nuclear ribonucleoprotein (snRNP)-like protein
LYLKQYLQQNSATDTNPARSFFKTLTNQVVTIELKNDIRIRGTLKSVDQYLNIKLDDIDVLDLDKYPHLSSVKNMFIRGSVVRYVVLPRSEVDVGLLEDATRRGMSFVHARPSQELSVLDFYSTKEKLLIAIVLQRLPTRRAKLGDLVRSIHSL